MRKRVLLVDDQELDITLTRQALKDCDIQHEIVEAHDGFEGLQLLKSEEFDVVLLDLKMPKVDGFKVMKQIRTYSGFAATPIIVLTNSDLQSDRLRAEALGAVEYIHKSLEYTVFKSNLKTTLSAHGFC